MGEMEVWQRFTPVEQLMADNAEPKNPVVITGVVSLEENVGAGWICEVAVRRLLKHPRFCSVLRSGGNGRWYFKRVDGFDCDSARDHVVEEEGRVKGVKEFNKRVGEIMSRGLDWNRPLWKVHIFGNWSVVGGGCTLVIRVHHSISDGIGLIKLFSAVLTDGEEGVDGYVIPERQKLRVGGGREGDVGVLRRCYELVQDVYRTVIGVLIPDPDSALTRGRIGGRKVCAVLPPSRLSVDVLKEAGKILGVTLNDLLHAALTGALRRFLIDRGDDPDKLRGFRCAIPFNRHMLDAFQPSDVSNQFAILTVNMHVEEEDRWQRILQSAQVLQRLKRGVRIPLVLALLHVVVRLPQELRNALWRHLTRASSLVFTNVPGPRERVRVGGIKVTAAHFFAPTDGECGMVVSLFSYAGEVCIGISGDEGKLGYIDAFVDIFVDEIDQVIALAHQKEQTTS